MFIIEFIIGYFIVGLVFLIILNIIFYITHMPISDISESATILLIWPTVLVSFLNSFYEPKD